MESLGVRHRPPQELTQPLPALPGPQHQQLLRVHRGPYRQPVSDILVLPEGPADRGGVGAGAGRRQDHVLAGQPGQLRTIGMMPTPPAVQYLVMGGAEPGQEGVGGAVAAGAVLGQHRQVGVRPHRRALSLHQDHLPHAASPHITGWGFPG